MDEKIGSVVVADVRLVKLSRQHVALLRFVYHFSRQFGYAPTVREIARALEIPSTSMVNYYLRYLDNQGYIHRTSRASRSIRLLEAGYQAIGQTKPNDLQAEVTRLLAENRLLHERCEQLQRERNHLLSIAPVSVAASAST